jgi:UDP-3-O-[3-hydroxymyristoyl] N-acetylglucosamine deacetylase
MRRVTGREGWFDAGQGVRCGSAIAEKISCTHLHGGARAADAHPARLDTGIVFVRSDGSRTVEIPARADQVRSTQLATTLGSGDASVGTVEHLLAAIYGLGIDNIRIELDGAEVPVMDGSSASFVFLIRAAGIFEQRGLRRVLRVRRPVEVRDGERVARVEPARGFHVSYSIDFQHPAIGRQSLRGFGSARAASSESCAGRGRSASSTRSRPCGGPASAAADPSTTPSSSTRAAC